MSEPSKVLLIVSGGIAAYKAPDLVRKLIARGCEVRVVMTEAAASFCTELSLATVSGHPVRRSLLDPAEEGTVGHIELADWPELILVAPATANRIARAAQGLADDLAGTVLLATTAPVVWAPAMNTNMWRHPATRTNLAILAERGDTFVGPDSGDLACGWVGEGRMIDPPMLADAVRERLDRTRSLAGRRVLVTAGPTRAYLDPVRFVSNASTGEMGFRLAEAARARGAEVVLVAGPVALDTPAGVERVDVETGEQMLAACRSALAAAPVDVVAMVAAVADLVPASPATEKVGKARVLERFASMAWRAEVDILATLVREHGERTRFLGFGAQTVDAAAGDVDDQLERLGRAKLERKGCHALFVNRVGVPGTGFGSATNTGLLLVRGREGEDAEDAEDAKDAIEVVDAGAPRPKLALADWMLATLQQRGWA